MNDTNWTVVSNICYGCDRFLESNPERYPGCKEGGGYWKNAVPTDCPRLTKFEEQYNIPCQCGETGVRYPLNRHGNLLHIYCKHCGWGIDPDGQPSYYADLSCPCVSSALHYLSCGQLLWSKQSWDGFPYLVPRRCACGGIPVLRIAYKHANNSIETRFKIECNTCNEWGPLVDYFNEGRDKTWDEKMIAKTGEGNCAQLERRMAAKQRAEDYQRSLRPHYVKKPTLRPKDYYTSVEARRDIMWDKYERINQDIDNGAYLADVAKMVFLYPGCFTEDD